MCNLCETKPVYEFTNQRKLCKTCFIRWFQKKVLYTIRKFEMIKSGEVVGYNISSTQGRTTARVARTSHEAPRRCENLYEAPKHFSKKMFTRGNFRGVVLEDVLRMFAEKAIVELAPQAYPEESSAKILTKGIKLPSKMKLDKIAIASTTDLEADKIIHFLIDGKEKLNFPKQGKNIFPLYLFLDEEILLYAKLRNLKFKKIKEEKDKISKFIDELEKKHPEVKQAIVGGYLGS